MNDKLDQAFILSAGFGTRMRPLTNDVPKPLVRLGARPLLDYAIDDLCSVGVRRVVLNAHYLADQIHAYAKTRTDIEIIVVDEPEILETGGGLKAALGHFDDRPFYVLAGDAYLRGGADFLRRMAARWDGARMDLLLGLQGVRAMTLTASCGDYDVCSDGRAVRSLAKKGAYMFTSVRINHPRVFECTPNGFFSYLQIMDACEKAGRLYACQADGEQFFHLSRPEDLARVQDALFDG